MNTKLRKKITIRGSFRDLLRFIGHVSERGRLYRRASGTVPVEGRSTAIAAALHPEMQELIITGTRPAGPDTMVYVLSPEAADGVIAPFRAGSYLSFEVEIEPGISIRRPYSICCPPESARRSNAYEITVKKEEGSFIPVRINALWTPGFHVKASSPLGNFTYEPLRDGENLVFIAGGSGITPFRSLAEDILSRYPQTSIVLLHGARRSEELYFRDDFQRIASGFADRFSYIPVVSGVSGVSGAPGAPGAQFTPDAPGAPGEPGDAGNSPRAANGGNRTARTSFPGGDSAAEEQKTDFRSGFIGGDLIEEARSILGGGIIAVFLCGPPAMQNHVEAEIAGMDNPPRRYRKEDFGRSGRPGPDDRYTIAIRDSGETLTIEADPGETVLVALERAGLNPPSGCRSGSCGLCRSRLLEGEVDYDAPHEGLRRGDSEMGFFHPCVAMPRSDMIIEIPGRPVRSGHPAGKTEE